MVVDARRERAPQVTRVTPVQPRLENSAGPYVDGAFPSDC